MCVRACVLEQMQQYVNEVLFIQTHSFSLTCTQLTYNYRPAFNAAIPAHALRARRDSRTEVDRIAIFTEPRAASLSGCPHTEMKISYIYVYTQIAEAQYTEAGLQALYTYIGVGETQYTEAGPQARSI